MGLLDRDWFVEDHKKREEEYGGDFSLHSRKKTGAGRNDPKAVSGLSPIEQELYRIRKKRADANKAAIAVGALSLIYAALCFFGSMAHGIGFPIFIGLVNAVMCVQSETRKKKEGDTTNLNSWAHILTLLAVLAMFWLALR